MDEDINLAKRTLKVKGYSPSLGTNKEGPYKADDGFEGNARIISSLRDYFDFISEVETEYENPVFYRGQGNANYLLVPSSLRINPQNEDRMIDSFTRRFYSELSACRTSMEKLVLMQHFSLGTRCLDITENPLAALYFACQPMKKFRKTNFDENSAWGEVLLFQESKLPDDWPKPEMLKSVDSSNVSIMASTAFMEEKFSLWQLGALWKKDVDIGHDERYIDLKSIVRRSLIVRVPQNNPRIKNQQGAFIIVNANEVIIDDDDDLSRRITQEIIEIDNSDCRTFSALQENEQWVQFMEDRETWCFKFRKIRPYDEMNSIEEFKTDPFDIRRLFYKNKNGEQIVALIPPSAKNGIVRELSKFNITEDFIYPDMDTVANEINERINVK